MTPGGLMGERLARLMDVVPLDPTENGKNFDSRTLMMSSKRSVARPGVVDEGLAGVLLPHAEQSEARISMRRANRMTNSRSYLTQAGKVRAGEPGGRRGGGGGGG